LGKKRLAPFLPGFSGVGVLRKAKVPQGLWKTGRPGTKYEGRFLKAKKVWFFWLEQSATARRPKAEPRTRSVRPAFEGHLLKPKKFEILARAKHKCAPRLMARGHRQ